MAAIAVIDSQENKQRKTYKMVLYCLLSFYTIIGNCNQCRFNDSTFAKKIS
jgi:hypothetical protein